MALTQDIINKGFELASEHAAGSFSHFSQNGVARYRHELYAESVELREEIARHFMHGHPPGDLITERRPNESEAVKEYRISVYEQVTYSWAAMMVAIIRGTIFNPELFFLDYNEDLPAIVAGEDSLKNYIESGMPIDQPLLEWMKEWFLQIQVIDPNGWIAIIPQLSESQIAEFPERYRSPYPSYIPSTNVFSIDQNNVFALSTDKTSFTKDGVEYLGDVFLYFTHDCTLRYLQTGIDANGAGIFEVEALDFHEWGMPMVKQIGGVVSGSENKVLSGNACPFYLSHLQPAIPWFNTALKEFSDITSSITNHLHPKAWEAMIDCPTCKGQGYDYDGDQNKVKCSSCKGNCKVPVSSLASATSPHIGYTVAADDSGKYNIPAGYVNNGIAIGIIKEARDSFRSNIKEAFRSVSLLNVIEPSTGNRTAEERRYDQELTHTLYRDISKTVFNMYQWILDGINWTRYRTVLGDRIHENRVVVNAPNRFDTTNAFESLEKIKLAKEAGLPDGVIQQLGKDVTGKLIPDRTKSGKIAATIMRLDPLPALSYDEILGIQAIGGNIPIEDIQLKANLTRLVNLACAKNAEFLDMKPEQQREFLLGLLPSEEPQISQIENP